MNDVALPAELVGLARALSAVDIIVGADRITFAVGAMARLDAEDRRDLYWTTRLAYCSRRNDLERFDLAFAIWFGARLDDAPADTDGAADVVAAEDGGERPGQRAYRRVSEARTGPPFEATGLRRSLAHRSQSNLAGSGAISRRTAGVPVPATRHEVTSAGAPSRRERLDEGVQRGLVAVRLCRGVRRS